MQTLILTLHIIVCVLLIILVLLQAGKEGMGVIIGGGGDSVFGSGGAGGLLSKLTAFMAVLFLFTCLSYTYVSDVRSDNESVVLDVKLEETVPAESMEKNTPEKKEVAPVVKGDEGVVDVPKAIETEDIPKATEDTPQEETKENVDGIQK